MSQTETINNTRTVPEGYKQTAVGVIPEEWMTAQIKDCFVLENGMAIRPEEWKESGTPIIRIQNLNQHDASFNYFQGTFSERYLVKNSDLLFAWSGTKGVSFGARIWKGENALLNQHIFKATIKQNVCSNQFGYFLLLEAQQRVERLAHGFKSSFVHVTKKSLSNVILPLPPLPEQQKIAAILSTWDEAIEKTQKLIDQLKKRNKGLAQQLLTGKKRLKGYSGEWQNVPLDEIFTEIRDSNDGGHGHEVMTISSTLGLVSQEDKFERVIAGESLKRYTLLQAGDFAYNKGNSKTYPMGCVYQLTQGSALVPFVYICFSPTDKVYAPFYSHWFKDHGLDGQLKQIITSGARGDGLLNVNKRDFFGLIVPFPKKEEQQAIAQVLGQADTEQKLYEQKLAALQQQKKGLMQKLLTGEVRVKTA